MENDLNLLIEEERKRLRKEFFPENKSWWKSSNHPYTSTAFIANKNQYKFKEQTEFIIDNSKYTWIFVSLIWLLTFVLSIYSFIKNGTDDIVISIILLSVVSMWLYQTIKKNFDRNPKIIINTNGITIAEKEVFISWVNIVDTYIKEEISDDSKTDYLVICHYRKDYKIFEIIEISLGELSYSFKEVAFIIELLKPKR